MADIGLGAGLSGFAQGFAASFQSRKEREFEQAKEKNRTMRELLIKGALDPHNPGDPNDPALVSAAEELLGKEHVPMFQTLLAKNQDYVYRSRAKEAQALEQPLEPGEKISVKGEGGISTTRSGAPLPKPGKTLEQIKDESAARAEGAESVREPSRQRGEARAEARQRRKEQRAEQRKQVSEARAERRQFRGDVRKTAMKLSSDPATRGLGKRLRDYLLGVNPTEKLSAALAGIPAAALPPSLQAKQAEATETDTGQRPVAPLGGTTQSGRIKWSVIGGHEAPATP